MLVEDGFHLEVVEVGDADGFDQNGIDQLLHSLEEETAKSSKKKKKKKRTQLIGSVANLDYT